MLDEYLNTKRKNVNRNNLGGPSEWDLIEHFLPGSAGNLNDRQIQGLKTIRSLLPSLLRLSVVSTSTRNLFEVLSYKDLTISPTLLERANLLRELFDEKGSDKGSYHSYYLLYAKVLEHLRWKPGLLFEIGIGSNDESVLSNMGVEGKPGASLRAWQKFLPKTKILGADIDPSTFANLHGIETFWLDQTDFNTFMEIDVEVSLDSCLIIDDGLHSLDANLNTVSFALPKIKKRGFIVIEDVSISSLDMWRIVGQLISPEYRITFISFPISNLCIIRHKKNKIRLV
jgi:hypothetical protein